MGRYSSYGIATFYAIPLKDLEEEINRQLPGKSVADYNPEDLYSLYPEEVYDILLNEDYIFIKIKDCYNGTDIFSLLKDFSTITPYKDQLSPKILVEIGDLIKGKPIVEVLEVASRREYVGFQTFNMLYWTLVPIGDKRVYILTRVRGFLIGYSYDKTVTEDDTEPYTFLTYLLRYRLKENPLSSTLLAYLSV